MREARRWHTGICEAGLPTTFTPVSRMSYCHKRARWMVGGVILCGGCKRALEEYEASRAALASTNVRL